MAELEHPATETPPPPINEKTARRRWTFFGATIAIWVVLGTLLQGKNTQELTPQTLTDFQQWLNDLKDNIEQAKFDNNPIFWPINWLSDFFSWSVDHLQIIFVSDPSRPLQVAIIGWVGVIAISVWAGGVLAGIRIAGLVAFTMLLFGYLGFWEDSINTLILTGISVVVSVAIGLPMAIWMARSRRATAGLTPILDAMQTMPSFAYLAPLALLFGIGNPVAVAATVIYALPPIVRITAHGLRTVSPTTVEATTSMGSTAQQLLRKVQLPMAKRTVIVGLNQTIMAALSMSIIVAFVGAPGLGNPLIEALAAGNIGVGFVVGLCMVLMAIMLDRTTEAAGVRSEAQSRSRGGLMSPSTRKWIVYGSGALVLVAVYLSNQRLQWSVFPESTFGDKVAERVNSFVSWVIDTFGSITSWINDAVTNWLLNPLQDLVANSPWWLTAGVIMAIATLLGSAGRGDTRKLVVPSLIGVIAVAAAGLYANGNVNSVPWQVWWIGIVVLLVASSMLGCGGALQPVTVCLVVIFGIGLWNDSMVTLSMTLLATLAVMIFGIIFGVWMGRSRRVDAILRPFLDALQVMPSLVYLIPAVALFGIGRFMAIAAGVLYAVPVAIKLVADGVRGVTPTTVEAAESSGASTWQMISKVQIPMSKGSIVLAANQGLLFVLSMVVLGALVGGASLGYLVVSGFSQGQLFGKGLAAGIAITALGIMLDRITVHAAARYGRAETN